MVEGLVDIDEVLFMDGEPVPMCGEYFQEPLPVAVKGTPNGTELVWKGAWESRSLTKVMDSPI